MRKERWRCRKEERDTRGQVEGRNTRRRKKEKEGGKGGEEGGVEV